MQLAKVTSTSPLEVQLDDATTSVAAQKKDADLPALTIGNEVLVDVFDRKLCVLHKLVDA